MCGIIGYTGHRPAGPVVLDGLRRLEYRGYDSAGIALFDSGGELYVARATGKIDNLESRIEGTLPPAVAGIGHTRWATHGARHRPQRAPAPRPIRAGRRRAQRHRRELRGRCAALTSTAASASPRTPTPR